MNISFGVSSVTYDNQNNFKIDNVTIPCNISSDDSTKLLCNYTYESIKKEGHSLYSWVTLQVLCSKESFTLLNTQL